MGHYGTSCPRPRSIIEDNKIEDIKIIDFINKDSKLKIEDSIIKDYKIEDSVFEDFVIKNSKIKTLGRLQNQRL